MKMEEKIKIGNNHHDLSQYTTLPNPVVLII
jgi:hypothetical protein